MPALPMSLSSLTSRESVSEIVKPRYTKSVCKHLEFLQHNTGKQLPYNAEKRNAMVVIAVTPVSFVLIQCDDVCILHVLWYSTFPPAKTKDFIQLGCDYLLIALQYFSRDVILPRCLAGGKGIQSRFYFS